MIISLYQLIITYEREIFPVCGNAAHVGSRSLKEVAVLIITGSVLALAS